MKRLLSPKLALVLAVILLLGGCSPESSFERNLKRVTRPHEFSIAKWEFGAAGAEIKQTLSLQNKITSRNTSTVKEYFTLTEKVNSLEAKANAVRSGEKAGDLTSLQAELDRMLKEKTQLQGKTEMIIERQIRETLSREGIYHPLDNYLKVRIGFPPVNFRLAKPPNLLVVSPRDRITRLKEVTLQPDLTTKKAETIEEDVARLGVSPLVVEVGGMATYPAFIDNTGDLRWTLDAASEEWLHQYLTFKPLGFLYTLDILGLRRDYQIAIINETVASMLGKELGDIVYKEYYESIGLDPPLKEAPKDFDFNREMREIRKTVDSLLTEGMTKEAEDFMEVRRQFLAARGYYIRKLNQAYFAFYGTYADSPTSVDPIGAEVRELRSKSASIKDFLEAVSIIKNREDLMKALGRAESSR